MDGLIIALSAFLAFISFVIMMASTCAPHYGDTDKQVFKVTGSIFLVFASLLTWGILAVVHYNPNPIVLERPIQEIRNIAFYHDKDNNPRELEGSWKLADPKTHIINIKTYPGGWKYGIYVTESVKTELVQKNPTIEGNN